MFREDNIRYPITHIRYVDRRVSSAVDKRLGYKDAGYIIISTDARLQTEP